MSDIKRYLPYSSNPVIPDRDIYVIILCIIVAVFMVSIVIGFFILLCSPFGSGQLDGKLYCYIRDYISKTELIEEYEEGEDYMLIDLRYNNERHLKTSIYIGKLEMKDWDKLFREVSAQYQQQRSSGTRPIPFIINADDNIPMQSVINALNACKRAGVEKVEFAR